MTHERPAFTHGSIHARPPRRGSAASAAASIDGPLVHDAYGLHARTAGDPPTTGAGEDPLFQGMAFDPAGLPDFRTRAHSPTIERWTDQEPPPPLAYVDGLDVYAFCADNPIHRVEPAESPTPPAAPSITITAVPGALMT